MRGNWLLNSDYLMLGEETPASVPSRVLDPSVYQKECPKPCQIFFLTSTNAAGDLIIFHKGIVIDDYLLLLFYILNHNNRYFPYLRLNRFRWYSRNFLFPLIKNNLFHYLFFSNSIFTWFRLELQQALLFPWRACLQRFPPYWI